MRDEEDVAASTVRHLFSEGIDGVIVADNRSTDSTRVVLKNLQSEYSPLLIIDDPVVGYYQSEKMTDLAKMARGIESDPDLWILPVDADEVWYSFERQTIKDAFSRIPAGVDVVGVQLWNHFVTGKDVDNPFPFLRIVYRQPVPGQLDKVAFRYREGVRIAQGNHGVLLNDVWQPGAGVSVGIRHFPYRSFDHFVRKARNGAEAYRATTLPENVGEHWRGYGRILEEHGPEGLRGVFDKWFSFPDPDAAGMVFDPAPFLRFA